jgi:branched-chain amino acid transport system substrate-binding protein
MAPASSFFRAILAFLVLAGPAVPAAGEIRIGFANPLSGPYTATGHRNRVAAELAVQELNLDGGVLGDQVELVVADDGCGIERAAAAATTLIGAGVKAVIGHMCSHSSLIAAGLYETADILMITPSSTHPRLTEEGRRNVFRLIGRDDRQGQLAADLLAGRYEGARIAIVHDGTTYGAGLAQQTRRMLWAHDVREQLFLRYIPGADDYDDLVAQLIDAAVDVVYVGGYGPDAALILKSARARGAGFQMVGGDALAMDEFWSIAGEAGDGTIFTRPATRVDVAGADRLLERFKQRGLGERPGGLGIYAAVQGWAAAVERSGTAKPLVVARTLRRGRFDTILGRISFDRKGDLVGAGWDWHIWQDGRFRPLDETATQ